MPITNCYIKTEQSDLTDFNKLTNEWAESLEVDNKDIKKTFHSMDKNFDVMVNIFLPSLWSNRDIEKIQKTLSGFFVKHLKIKPTLAIARTVMGKLKREHFLPKDN